MSPKVLIAGASGNVGSAAVDAFLREGWDVVSLSRRRPEVADPKDFHFCFAYGATEPPPPAFVSAVKLRQAGFTQVIDTEEMFRFWLGSLIDRKIVPSP